VVSQSKAEEKGILQGLIEYKDSGQGRVKTALLRFFYANFSNFSIL
tara:strand:- start:232 stop:369 length:138 start_codon:yes stop_codon:yes gene_type:complete